MRVGLKAICLETEKALFGIEFSSFEAKELVGKVFSCSSTDILLDKKVEPTPEQEELLSELVARRLSGEPLQYLLGEWDFYRRKFFVGEGVLIPRADTEVLIEAVLPFLRQQKEKTVLDLCSGSGCIAVTLAEEVPGAQVTAVELSEKAFVYLRKNNALYGEKAELIQGDALKDETVQGSFSLIVSNPPYLSKKDMDELQREVSFEPAMALYGEEDGLLFYRELTKLYAKKLNPGGMLAYEIGEGQETAVKTFMEQNGLSDVRYYNDYGSITRVVTAIKKGNR